MMKIIVSRSPELLLKMIVFNASVCTMWGSALRDYPANHQNIFKTLEQKLKHTGVAVTFYVRKQILNCYRESRGLPAQHHLPVVFWFGIHSLDSHPSNRDSYFAPGHSQLPRFAIYQLAVFCIASPRFSLLSSHP